MKYKIIPILIILFISVCNSRLISQEYKNLLLNDIAGNIGSYQNKTITLTLRLKNIDLTFDKIAFYDRKNNDIIFDIAELNKTKQYKKEAQNLHRGLEYNVTFIVKNVTKHGIIMGDLLSFQPLILSKLPD